MTMWNIKDNKKTIYHHMSSDDMYEEEDILKLKDKLLEKYSEGDLDSQYIKGLFGETGENREKKSIALFPGKFQPPHLGHIRTLLNLYEEYDKIYICITEGGPRLIPIEESYKILKEVFRYLPKYEVIKVKGSIYERNAFNTMPDFDIFVSANIKAINIAKQMGYKTKFISRTKGIGYSGTSLRKLAKLEDII